MSVFLRRPVLLVLFFDLFSEWYATQREYEYYRYVLYTSQIE